MFNFKELKLNKRTDSDNDPFIGIRRSEPHGFEFRLPVGFEDFPEGNFELTKRLFFRMYRGFKKFEQDNLKDLQQSETTGKDNIEVSGNAGRFKDREGNDIVLYREPLKIPFQWFATVAEEISLERKLVNFDELGRNLVCQGRVGGTCSSS